MNAKRVKKVQNLCKNYLYPIQKSVFEGEITESRLNTLKMNLKNVIHPDEDSVIIYHLDSVKYAKKEQLGLNHVSENII